MRRRFLLAAAAGVVAAPQGYAASSAPQPTPQPAPAASEALRIATDLAADLLEAQRQHAPLLIMIALDPCPFCHEVRTHYLIPMQRRMAAGQAPWVVIREVRLDRETPLLDFAQRRTTHRAWARTQGAKVAPTLVAFDPRGERTGELVGAGLAGFYDAYLERLLADARASQRSRL